MLGLSTDALLLLGVGLLPAVSLALDAIWTLLGPIRLRSRAEGAVVGWDAASLGNPIVEFVADDGTAVRYIPHLDRYPAEGERVPLRYSPRAPHRARVATLEDTYLNPLLMLALAPVFASLAWTMATRFDRVAPADRVAAYVPLSTALQSLDACTRSDCSQRSRQRRMQAYDRARSKAAAVASPAVAARVDELQRTLGAVGRRARRARAAASAALSQTLWAELSRLVAGCDDRSTWKAECALPHAAGPSR